MKRLALFLSLLIVASCGGGSTTPDGPDALTGTTWRLQTLQRAGASSVTIEAPDRFTLLLSPEGGRASVRADCNSCGGGYALDGARLEVFPLACTLIACNGALDGEDLALLGGATRASADGSGLLLTSDRGTLRFTR